MIYVEVRGTTILVSPSYFAFQSLTRFLGSVNAIVDGMRYRFTSVRRPVEFPYTQNLEWSLLWTTSTSAKARTARLSLDRMIRREQCFECAKQHTSFCVAFESRILGLWQGCSCSSSTWVHYLLISSPRKTSIKDATIQESTHLVQCIHQVA